MLDPYAGLTPAEESTIDQMPPASRQALERARRADATWRRRKAAVKRITPPQPPDKEQSDMADSLSSKPWDGDASNYDSPDAYCSACLVDENDGGGPKTKSKCHLPVKEPGGAYNRVALGQAAARLAQTSIPPAAKKAAARKLIGIYRQHDLTIPDSLKNMAL